MYSWMRLMICLLPLAGCGTVKLSDVPVHDQRSARVDAAPAPQASPGAATAQTGASADAGGQPPLAQEPLMALSALKHCPPGSSGQWDKCLGSLRFPNGEQYLGRFDEGRFNGVGLYTYADGHKYVGEYRNNRREGQGIVYLPDGSVFLQGRWANDELVRSFLIDSRRFPFAPPPLTAAASQPAAATAAAQPAPDQLQMERDRLSAEAQAARLAQKALEQQLATEARERSRLAAEAQEARRQQQLQQAQTEAALKAQQELERRLETEAREREKLAAQAQEARRVQQELQERLALEEKERERLAVEARERTRLQPNRPASSRNEKRIALVIGNAAYRRSPLDNPVNDATDIDQALRGLGFRTILVRNASLGQMREATRRFADQLSSADVALIYFAGHGVESNRKNYMIPVDADLKFEYELSDQAYDAGIWLDMFENIKSSNTNRVNIVILDACRDNRLIGARSMGRGLGRMDAPTGTFLSYSTSPGRFADDGVRGERNSPFTKHLLRAMLKPNLPIEEVFKEVRRNVSGETKGAQVPWESTSLTGFFTFREGP